MHIKGLLEVDYPRIRKEVMAKNMVLEGYTLDMGFGVRNTILNPITTGRWEI